MTYEVGVAVAFDVSIQIEAESKEAAEDMALKTVEASVSLTNNQIALDGMIYTYCKYNEIN